MKRDSIFSIYFLLAFICLSTVLVTVVLSAHPYLHVVGSKKKGQSKNNED